MNMATLQPNTRWAIQCPKCDGDNILASVECSVHLRASPDGRWILGEFTDADSVQMPRDDDYACCVDCDFYGSVGNFVTEKQS